MIHGTHYVSISAQRADAAPSPPAVTPVPSPLAIVPVPYEQDVTELCALAGFPERASDYIAARTPIAAVRQDLGNLRAAKDAAVRKHDWNRGVDEIYATRAKAMGQQPGQI